MVSFHQNQPQCNDPHVLGCTRCLEATWGAEPKYSKQVYSMCSYIDSLNTWIQATKMSIPAWVKLLYHKKWCGQEPMKIVLTDLQVLYNNIKCVLYIYIRTLDRFFFYTHPINCFSTLCVSSLILSLHMFTFQATQATSRSWTRHPSPRPLWPRSSDGRARKWD